MRPVPVRSWSIRAEKRIAEDLGFNKEDVHNVIESYINAVFKELCETGAVRAGKLGLFRLKYTQYKTPVEISWSPISAGGKIVKLRTHRRYNVYFSLGRDLKRFLKERFDMSNDEMQKYGVDEDGEDREKTAAKGCPVCGTPADRLIKHGHVIACPNCGTEPFEGKR